MLLRGWLGAQRGLLVSFGPKYKLPLRCTCGRGLHRSLFQKVLEAKSGGISWGVQFEIEEVLRRGVGRKLQEGWELRGRDGQRHES